MDGRPDEHHAGDRALADPPFPLWRPVDPSQAPNDEIEDGEFTERAVLPATQAEVMAVYRRLLMPRVIPAGMTTITIRGAITPDAADKMPLWVIAELLEDERPPDDGLETQEEFEARAAADQARRLAEATPEQRRLAVERAEAMRSLAERSDPAE